MRQSRFNALHQGMSSTAKKVFAVVPILEHWSPSQIASELRRQGSSVDFKIVAGCIAALVSSGLVIEGKPGYFTRVKVTEPASKAGEHETQRTAQPEKESQVAETTTSQEKQGQTALAKLGALGERASAIGLMLKTLGDDITKVAIEIDDETTAREAETGKIRQLQQLLKELGG